MKYIIHIIIMCLMLAPARAADWQVLVQPETVQDIADDVIVIDDQKRVGKTRKNLICRWQIAHQAAALSNQGA